MDFIPVDIYRTYFELAKAISFVLDTQGNVLEINRKGCELLGYPKAEIIGKNWFDHFIPNSQREDLRASFLGVLECAKAPFEESENSVITRSGEERLIHWDNTFFVGRRGNIGAISSGEDITECRRIEVERERFFNLSLDMLCICYFDGNFKDVNPAFSQTLGWPRETLMAQPVISFIHPDDVTATESALQDLQEGASVLMFATRYRCKDGTYKWLSCNAFPLLDEQLIFAVVRDISEQRAIEQQLRESRDQLHHFEKLEAVGRLAGGVAHDFNNQLASIMGCADLLQEVLEDQPDLKKYTEIILSAAEYSAKLTNQLLAFARKGKYRSVSVNLHQIIDQVLAMLSQSTDKKIQITTDLQAVKTTVKGDPSQLQNALLNVVINARDAMPNGGQLHVMTDNTLHSSPQKGYRRSSASTRFIKVVVSDTGVGMDREVQSHIFEPFFTTKNDGKGRGLGLASVYGTVTNHNGSISVSSTPGEGSAFTLLFPLNNDSTGRIVQRREGARPPNGTVLLVDDEHTVLEAVEMMLRSLRYEVFTCTNGPDALVKFQEHPEIDFVILDLVMPDWNGIKTFSELKKVDSRVKVLLSSGYSINGEAEQLMEYGASGFLKKPFRKQQLMDAIQRLDR